MSVNISVDTTPENILETRDFVLYLLGYVFDAPSPSETMLYIAERVKRFGPDGLCGLMGHYAVVILDKHTETVIAYREPAGMVGLYTKGPLLRVLRLA